MTARRQIGLIALLSWALVGCTASPVTTVIHQAPTARPSASTADSVLNPLAIDAMRQRDYPGSDPVVEQTLAPGSNYRRFIASYHSDG